MTEFQSRMSESRTAWGIAIVVMLGTVLILTSTAPAMPLVWDEGQYLLRADLIVTRVHRLVEIGSPDGGLHALSATAIGRHWRFINYGEGHPAWFAVPIVISKVLMGGLLSPLTAARVGPIVAFSIACGAVAFRLFKHNGPVAALAAPIALLTLPRMFSEAHFATQDAQLTAWWLLHWAADSSPNRGPRSTVKAGILLGLTCATKFTGWLAWFPVAVSRFFRRDGARRRELLLLPVIALVTFYAVNPLLWHDPVAGVKTHLRRSLQRTGAFDIPTMFLGERYTVQHSLPWYNTIVWLLIVTPVPILVLGLVGLHRIGSRASIRSDRLEGSGLPPVVSRWLEPQSVALLLHWATLMVARALPGAPPHDGIRLFLPAFGFWCVFAGIGAQSVWDFASYWPRNAWQGRTVRAGFAAAFVATGLNLARYYPQTLSHYNALVGGVRGAALLGMEPTYWWDAMDDEVLTWINQHTESTETVAFSSIAPSNLNLLRSWGGLRVRAVDASNGHAADFKWYILQNRPGIFGPVDRALMTSQTPVYTKYAGHAKDVLADLKVPLIMIFSYDQFKEALVRLPAFSRD